MLWLGLQWLVSLNWANFIKCELPFISHVIEIWWKGPTYALLNYLQKFCFCYLFSSRLRHTLWRALRVLHVSSNESPYSCCHGALFSARSSRHWSTVSPLGRHLFRHTSTSTLIESTGTLFRCSCVEHLVFEPEGSLYPIAICGRLASERCAGYGLERSAWKWSSVCLFRKHFFSGWWKYSKISNIPSFTNSSIFQVFQNAKLTKVNTKLV